MNYQRSLTLTLLLTAALPHPPAEQDPAVVVRHALAAAEGDSAGVLERRWSRTMRRTPADRVASLGLATLAHYIYRDSLADRLYRDVLAETRTDRIAGYAALGLARLAGGRARWPAADSAVQLALSAGRATRDSSLVGEALVYYARVRLYTAGPQAALATVAEAEAVLPPTELGVRALARCSAAEASDSLGDARTAVQAAREGIALAERARNQRALATCNYQLAVGQANLFAVDSALAAYARAITTFRRVRDRAGLAKALWWRGDFQRLFGQLGHARRDAQQAVEEAEASASWTISVGARATLAQIAMSVGDVQAAVMEADRIKQILDRHDDPYARVIAPSIAERVAVALGDVAAARAANDASVRTSQAIGWLNGEVGARNSRMWIALQEGDSAGAFLALDAARQMISSRPGLQGHSDGVTFFEGTLALRWGNLAGAERIFRNRRASAQSRGVRRYVDAARLAEVLARTGRLDEAERELLAATGELDEWRQSLGDRQLRLLAFQVASDRADPDLGVASVIAALARAGRIAAAFEVVERGRARDLSDRLTRAAALDTISGDVARHSEPPLRLDSVQRALPDDSTALFEFMTGRGDPTTLFVITRKHARAYVLASQDALAQPIARLDALLESGDDPRALGRELGTALLTPALAQLDPTIRRWIIVPDGPLHRLPFDALVLPDGQFVLQRFAVTSAPSATVAARLAQRAAYAPPTALAVLADPRFAVEIDAPLTSDVFRSALSGKSGLPRLRGSAREGRAVARYAHAATVRLRANASEDWLKRTSLAEFGIVHFATHALVDESSVASTALALAPAGLEDGFVGISELAGLRLSAELVVLSACSTARGAIVRGEGVQGLAAPLIAAGARAVATTWWPIGDAETVQLVDDFYRAMSEGQPVSEALRQAKLAAMHRGAPPRAWAAFTLVGDPLARPPLRRPSDRTPLGLIIALALLAPLAGYGVVMRRRRTAERR
ncbi:MAG: CHAT domain-containing protein [Longimicrobiales bacterium]